MDDKQKLICKQLKTPKTANEVVDRIFKSDLRKGKDFVLKERSWRYYANLNKLFAPMERMGFIEQVSTKRGNSNRIEKVWIVRGVN